ncbi:MAG: carboxymuconolactone decarboxylase family protein [Clostridia bacterium]|nr:carboxymuconolactone decarboxylase family protein [Clostridia bacterium]
MDKKIVQTAGRAALGEFAPDFAHFNDDILFGENWNNTDIDIKTRCIITVVSLMSQGICDSSLKHHLQNAKNNGVTKKEIAAAITHTAFYAGWPKGWATFNFAKEVWDEHTPAFTPKDEYQNSIFFPIGAPNDAYAKYFKGQSYLAPISKDQVFIANVTFEPKCRNNWHIHEAEKGGGQILVCVGGEGYYQEWGKPAIKMQAGDVVNIPVGVKHWHGAGKGGWFSHLAIEVPAENVKTQWLECVSDEDYDKAVGKQ